MLYWILPNVMTWRSNEDPSMGFTSTYVKVGDERILVDPALADERVLDAVERAGTPTAIIITSHWHERHAADYRTRWGAPIWVPDGHAAHLETFDDPDHTYDETTPLPGGVRPISIGWEYALALPGDPKVVIAGDVVGALGKWVPNAERLGRHPGAEPDHVRPLLLAKPDRLLMAHGTPVVSDVMELLEALAE